MMQLNQIMTELPLAALERMLKRAGAKRVSKDATAEYASLLEGYVSSVAKDAALLAEHAGRNTVLEKDVLLAGKRMRQFRTAGKRAHA